MLTIDVLYLRHKIAPSKKHKFNKRFNGDGANFMRELYEHNAIERRKERKFYGRGVAASAKYKHSRNMKF